MNIEDSFRYDVHDRAVRDGCTEDEASRRLLAEHRARCDAEEAKRSPAEIAERERWAEERAERHARLLDVFRKRYGDFTP